MSYLGQTGFTILTGLFFIAILVVFYLDLELLKKQEGHYLLFMSPFVILVTYLLWKSILTKINIVSINFEQIILKNIVTRQSRIFTFNQLAGYKDSFKNGFSIEIIDKNGVALTELIGYYYQDFQELIDKLNLEYLGRKQTWTDKILDNIFVTRNKNDA